MGKPLLDFYEYLKMIWEWLGAVKIPAQFLWFFQLLQCILKKIGGDVVMDRITSKINLWLDKHLLDKPKIKKGLLNFWKNPGIFGTIYLGIILLIGFIMFNIDNALPQEPPITCKIDDCDITNDQPPCWFTVNDIGNSSIGITEYLELNHEHAERIAELNRDEDGLINRFMAGDHVIVPHPDEKRSVENLLCYLNDLPLTVVFEECNENADMSHYPCIYEIKEEIPNYAELAINRYGYSNDDVIEDLVQANDFEFFINAEGNGDLRQLSPPFAIGTIVYIPVQK